MKPLVLPSLDHPSIQPYRTLRRSEEHVRQGIFVAEGEKVVRRLLNSSLEFISFLLTPEWVKTLSAEEVRFRSFDGEVFIAPREILEEIVGYRLHQGIMAVGRVPRDPDLRVLARDQRSLVIALDGLMNAENVGVVVRNCAGLGGTMIITGETSSSPYLRRSVRNSMGTVFQIPVLHSAHLASDLKRLKGFGVRVFGADLGGTPLSGADLSDRTCIVLGNEESGLTEPVRSVCDALVAIPMHNGTDSLNVASAAAVFLYETTRQRSASQKFEEPNPKSEGSTKHDY